MKRSAPPELPGEKGQITSPVVGNEVDERRVVHQVSVLVCMRRRNADAMGIPVISSGTGCDFALGPCYNRQMKIPRAVERLVAAFEKLPGIGPKTAQRLTFYLLHVPQEELDRFSEAIKSLKLNTKICSTCFNIGETDPCQICSDRNRDQTKLCVVEEPLDVAAIERSDGYHGLYHVLHGRIEPLRNIGPDELHIRELLPRLGDGRIREIILATNPTMEGEATAMYVAKLVREVKSQKSKVKSIKITRIGRGLPVGGDLEYADDITLTRAMEGRREF